MRSLVVAALIAVSAPALAHAAPADEPYPHFGASLALGAPDGAVASLIGSPWYWLIADVGFAYTLQPGIVAGVTLQPIDFAIAPTLRGEYGHYFTGNAGNYIKKWANVPTELQPFISEASYSWWSAYLGLAIGSRRGFTFRIEGGVGWITLYVKGASATFPGDNVTVSTADTKFTGFVPMARLTFAYYF